MERIWLDAYPPGVPAEIDSSAYRNISALIEQSFSRFHAKPAFACDGKQITYGELDRMSAALAAWLQSRGLERGARVAIMMPNVLQYPISICAVLRAGYVVVNVNPLYTPRELQHQLNDSGAEAIVILDGCTATLDAVLAHTQVKHVLVAAQGNACGAEQKPSPYAAFDDAIEEGRRGTFVPASQSPDDVAFLQYTGGTTGVSKGATLLHRNIVANVLQSDLWLKPARDLRPDVTQLVTVAALPLYHIFALNVCCLLTMHMGALSILVPNPRDIGGMIESLAGYKVTNFPGVNTLFNAMLHHPEFSRLDFSNLLLASGGGMATQEAVARRWKEMTGATIIDGYGLSETSPCVAINPVTGSEFNGTIGLPLPSTEVSIRDDDGNELPPGVAGELCIRGPQVMAGYWQRPDETAKVMTADGFFRSGDIASISEAGFVRIVDRKKDMILVSGFNVYPNEIEEVVANHPGVYEVAAIGVPDEHSGEAVKLFVVRKDPALTFEDLMAFCKGQLTGYKRPKSIEFRDSLPKSNVGKILRRELRASNH
ncbi:MULTISPECIES: long-chain-fatty-acid--CoA ligase [Burkholderia]|uniref:long-chain-fatty-acid--CoA ligase n=1 Tax=Burkholderia TaxID=32008 RepID=UPI000B7A1612|nr:MULTISPECIES: long-chain-fatty-acid--CoA ligase [Burkholderia]OXI92534.1 long-chain fatty acid--CoA ligase [Burkholderia sp. AU33803]PRD87148.1 long-chain-fatty-acid--CoA ligase [Burkholderia contaminans]